MTYRTNAAFLMHGNWVPVSWTSAEPDPVVAVRAMAKAMEADDYDLANADHFPEVLSAPVARVRKSTA